MTSKLIFLTVLSHFCATAMSYNKLSNTGIDNNQVCLTTICDCDEVYRHWGVDGAIGTGYTVDATTNPNLWKLTFSNSTPPIYFDPIAKYLYYTKVVGSCSTKYVCYMTKPDMFVDIMKKAFKVSPLETFLPVIGSNVTVGSNHATYSSISLITKINFRLTPNTYLILEYNANNDILTDVDNPGKRYVQAVKCPNTQAIKGNGGSGGGGEPPAEGVQTNIIDYVQDGDPGADGADAPDGDGDNTGEQDGGGLPPPENNGDGFIETNYDPNIATVRNANMELIVAVKTEQISTWQQCSLYSIDGKLIATKALENGKTDFKYRAPGIYLLVFKGNGKTMSQKVLVS